MNVVMLTESFTYIEYIIYILSFYKKRKKLYNNRLFNRHRKLKQYLKPQIPLFFDKK